MDVRERVKICPSASGLPTDLSGRDEMFCPDRGMTEDEVTQGSCAAALRNHRREMRTMLLLMRRQVHDRHEPLRD